MWAEVGESACVVSLSLPWQLRVLHKQGLEAPSEEAAPVMVFWYFEVLRVLPPGFALCDNSPNLKENQIH